MRPRFRFAFRLGVVSLLACLVPLQALVAAIIAVAGPSHTHRPAVASTRLVLDDFRRAPPRPLAEAHIEAALRLHPHAHGAAERHRHAAGDASVVVDTADRVPAVDAEDLAFSPSLAVFVGLIPAPQIGIGVAGAVRATAPAGWRMQTHHPDLPERPPRTTA